LGCKQAAILRALGNDDAELTEMATYGVDHLRALLDEQVTGSEYQRLGLLCLALHLYKPHGWALRRLANRLGIRRLVLLPLYERLHVGGRDKAHCVAQPTDLSPPVMRASARFHGDDARWLGREKREHLCPPQLLAEYDGTRSICAVCLEDVLRDIQPIV
jgi:hypothetical protein